MPAQSSSRKASHAERHKNFFRLAADAFSADGDADDIDEGDSDVARITTDIGRSTLRGVITFVLRPISGRPTTTAGESPARAPI